MKKPVAVIAVLPLPAGRTVVQDAAAVGVRAATEGQPNA